MDMKKKKPVIRQEFPHKTMFGSSLLPVICMRPRVLFVLFVFLCAYWCLTHIVLCFCFVCSSSCAYWCLTHIVLCFCFRYLHLVCSGLSIWDYPFGIIYHLCRHLCLGHCGWLLLNLWICWLFNNLTMSVPGEVYSTHALCAFHMLSTFLLTVV